MNDTTTTVKVWDPIVRIGHWLLVLAFFTAYLLEDDLLTVHVWAGYVVGAIVVIRVLWGFIGTRHARFADFVRQPAVVLAYLNDLRRGRAAHYLGHNPAGGAMVIALLLSLAVTVTSGLMVYAYEEQAGPLAAWVGKNGGSDSPAEDVWEEIHEVAANFTLLLIGLHVAGVAWSSRVEKQNLVRAMLTGRKPRQQDPSSGRISGPENKD